MTSKGKEEEKREETATSQDESRRQFLRKAIIATGFAIPVIQSFSVRELRIPEAEGRKGAGDRNKSCQ